MGETASEEVAGSARERLLDAAHGLFCRHGIRTVGVDTIVAKSGADADGTPFAFRAETTREAGIGYIGPDGSEPARAGVGEVRFDDLAAAESALARPDWRADMDDAAACMDLEGVSAVWVEEHTVLVR